MLNAAVSNQCIVCFAALQIGGNESEIDTDSAIGQLSLSFIAAFCANRLTKYEN